MNVISGIRAHRFRASHTGSNLSEDRHGRSSKSSHGRAEKIDPSTNFGTKSEDRGLATTNDESTSNLRGEDPQQCWIGF